VVLSPSYCLIGSCKVLTLTRIFSQLRVITKAYLP
jgi:hypothetical protein